MPSKSVNINFNNLLILSNLNNSYTTKFYLRFLQIVNNHILETPLALTAASIQATLVHNYYADDCALFLPPESLMADRSNWFLQNIIESKISDCSIAKPSSSAISLIAAC